MNDYIKALCIGGTVVSLALGIGSIFTLQKTDCPLGINSPHAHFYKSDKYAISTIMTGEDSETNYFSQTPEYISITGFESQIFDECRKKEMFYCPDYPLFADNRADDCDQLVRVCDYLEYYYYRVWYTNEKVVDSVTYDEKGNRHEKYHYERKRHVDEGWTTNRNHSDLTGKLRYNHPLFYGGRFEFVDGELKLVYSPKVDDVREVINDYPYTSPSFYTYTSKIYNVPSSVARVYDVTDFDDFYRPKKSDYKFVDGLFVKNNSKIFKK